MTPVGCYSCHRLMRKGDEAVAVIRPAVTIALDGSKRPSVHVRYLCPECGDA